MGTAPSMLDPALVAAARAAVPEPQDQGVRDRVVLITGGASGLGAATAGVLASAGARVVIADVDFERGHDRANTLGQHGLDAIAMPCDVSDETQVRALIDRVHEHHGRLDVLINNAAIDLTAPVSELDSASWERELRINLTGAFLLVRHALPRLGRGSHIVNIVSTAAKRAWPHAAATHASQWGLLGFSHALHAELRPAGIKVTAIVAGGMRTALLPDRVPDLDTAAAQDPVEVAQTIRFVLSQPTGTVIPEVMILPMAETSWP